MIHFHELPSLEYTAIHLWRKQLNFKQDRILPWSSSLVLGCSFIAFSLWWLLFLVGFFFCVCANTFYFAKDE